MRRTISMLAAILLVAAVLRMYGVWEFPFEQDELYTVEEATNLFHTALKPGIQARPFFFLIQHPLVVALPNTPPILRILPLIFGILGVWATAALGRRVLGDRGAIVAALLVALSPWHLQASGFARYYSLLYLLATLIYWRLPVALESNRPRDYLMVLGALLVGTWTHPSFVFPVAAATLGAFWVSSAGAVRWSWPSRTAWIYLWGPFVLVSLVVWSAIRIIHPVTTVGNGEVRGLAATLRLIPAMVDWMTVMVAAAGAIGMLLMVRSRYTEWRRFGLMAIFGMMGMGGALFALSFVTAIYADYGIAALPLFIVAAAGLVEWIAREVQPRRAAVVAGVMTTVLIMGVWPSLVSHLSDGTRFDYRPAFTKIAADGPQDAVLTWPIALQRAYAPNLRAYEFVLPRQRLDSILSRERRLWAVVSAKRFGVAGDDTGELTSWLGDHCRQVDQFQRPRLDYRMYRVELWRCDVTS